MPTITCPKCKKVFEIPLKTLGKKVRCNRCDTSFEAQVTRQEMRKEEKRNPMVYVFIGLGVVFFIFIALLVSASLKDEPDQAAADKGDEQVEVETQENAEEGIDQEKPAFPNTEREAFCLEFLQAVANNDVDAIQRMFNYPEHHRIHRDDGDPQWGELNDFDKIMKKEEYTNRMTDDTAQGGGFIRKSNVIFMKELAWDGQQGEVEVGFKHKYNSREQERTFLLMTLGKNLMVYDYTVGPEHGGDLDWVEEEKPETLDEKYKRRISPEGEVARVDYPAETGEAVIGELEMLVEDLIGDNTQRAKKAKRRLEKFEKTAIPALLNGIVPLDLTKGDDVIKANACISVLRKITGRRFGFRPGFIADVELESQAADLQRGIKRWFGWWERNKDTWTGRPEESEEGEELEDS